TTSFTTSYDEKTTSSFIQGMADRDIPLHVFHFDCYWMRGYHWCDFCWDPDTFPDPQGMLARYKARGLHICCWINPYIGQASPLFAEGMQHGYLLKKTNGDVWQTDLWQAGMGVVDVTNPAARDWYCCYLKKLMDMGVDCFKTDFGERIPVKDIAYFDGSDALHMHNYYTFVYNKMVFELLERERGKGDAVLFARSATAGGQQFPVHWGGDNSACYASMAETLRAGLSISHSGFGFWSHDISGFEQTAPADVYKRWAAFGLLSSHSRLHGSSSYRVPWMFDDEACDVVRQFTKLKCALMPYLYGAAVEAHQAGTPMLRPMMLEFPGDPGCDTLDRQYMLGGSLLVAPVFSAAGDVDFYLPEGEWTNLLDGHVVVGGGWRKERHGFQSLPLMVREGSLLAMGAHDDRPDYDYADDIALHLYQLKEGQSASCVVPALDGAAAAWFEVTLKEGKPLVKTDSAKPYHLVMHNAVVR
ncbi:MAG: alpha-xylosidase, partial [Clostridia bacterium]